MSLLTLYRLLKIRRLLERRPSKRLARETAQTHREARQVIVVQLRIPDPREAEYSTVICPAIDRIDAGGVVDCCATTYLDANPMIDIARRAFLAGYGTRCREIRTVAETQLGVTGLMPKQCERFADEWETLIGGLSTV